MEPGTFMANELTKTREWTQQLLEDFEGDDWGYQLKDELFHATWLVGHVAWAQHGLVMRRCFGEGPLDAAFSDPFKIGTTPGPVSGGAYPAVGDLLAHFDRVQEMVVDKVRGMTAADLETTLEGKPHPMFSTRGGAVVHSTRHEAFHAGQIATIRRMLGRSPLR
jgi:hypothetical protein